MNEGVLINLRAPSKLIKELKNEGMKKFKSVTIKIKRKIGVNNQNKLPTAN